MSKQKEIAPLDKETRKKRIEGGRGTLKRNESMARAFKFMYGIEKP